MSASTLLEIGNNLIQSPSVTTEINNPTKNRGNYVKSACRPCAKLKIKCTGEKPCDRCTKQKIVCIYEEPKKRGPKEGQPVRRSRSTSCDNRHRRQDDSRSSPIRRSRSSSCNRRHEDTSAVDNLTFMPQTFYQNQQHLDASPENNLQTSYFEPFKETRVTTGFEQDNNNALDIHFPNALYSPNNNQHLSASPENNLQPNYFEPFEETIVTTDFEQDNNNIFDIHFQNALYSPNNRQRLGASPENNLSTNHFETFKETGLTTDFEQDNNNALDIHVPNALHSPNNNQHLGAPPENNIQTNYFEPRVTTEFQQGSQQSDNDGFNYLDTDTVTNQLIPSNPPIMITIVLTFSGQRPYNDNPQPIQIQQDSHCQYEYHETQNDIMVNQANS
ncbi:3575_t:CDS:1 [Scutellospora calospora]|uniref:3575_t:CDS:1 n=1 Tax=Scutellospora calospora TaxID=85575 RepID=A0ACA9LIB9_9GLOM|nr:3575_t:CDS:1 [Scutellospora calospora]